MRKVLYASDFKYQRESCYVLIVPAYVDTLETRVNVKVPKGKIALMKCPAHGIPQPRITWLKNGHVLPFNIPSYEPDARLGNNTVVTFFDDMPSENITEDEESMHTEDDKINKAEVASVGLGSGVDGRLRLLLGGRMLELAMANEADAAVYTCLANNSAGTTSMVFNLSVIGQLNI